MNDFRSRLSVAAMACGLAAGGFASAAFAGLVNFESPTYNTGQLASQDLWNANSYAAGNSANLVTVVTTNPINGAQSVRYANTGSADLHDHARRAIGTVITDLVNGTIDMLASLTMRAESSPLEAGFFFGPSDPTPAVPCCGINDGVAPIYVRLLNGNIERWTGGPFANVGSYSNGDQIDFLVEADLDGQTYNLLAKNVTQGQASFAILASNVGFGELFPDDGTPGLYDVGVGFALRRGTAAYDDVSVQSIIPEPSSLALVFTSMVLVLGTAYRLRFQGIAT